MRFSKLIKKRNVFSQLQSAEREGAIREIVGLLMKNGEIPEDGVEPVVKGLLARERLGTTGIGKGVAIPHVRHEGLKNILVAVGQSAAGLDFSAVDAEPVKVIFLIISPESAQDVYMESLRWVSGCARDDYYNKLLMGAVTPSDFIELFKDIEEGTG